MGSNDNVLSHPRGWCFVFFSVSASSLWHPSGNPNTQPKQNTRKTETRLMKKRGPLCSLAPRTCKTRLTSGGLTHGWETKTVKRLSWPGAAPKRAGAGRGPAQRSEMPRSLRQSGQVLRQEGALGVKKGAKIVAFLLVSVWIVAFLLVSLQFSSPKWVPQQKTMVADR